MIDSLSSPQSSNVAGAYYDETTMQLTVRFKKGGAYVYFPVPKEVWTSFKIATSKGKFVHNHLKNRFSYRRIA